MNLIKFIASIGDQEAAKLFGVKERIVASWRRVERTPGSTNTAKIIQSSKGQIKYEDILKHRKKLAAKEFPMERPAPE